MAFSTKTIDSIVREELVNQGLSMHWYVDFLLPALSELQELAVRHKMSAKQIQLTINSYNRVSIPDDCIYVIDVSVKEKERILPAVRDHKLNLLYNTDGSGNKIPHPDSTEGDSITISDILNDYYLDSNRYSSSGWYGFVSPEDNTFNIDYENSEIVFSNDFDYEAVVLTYAADPASTTAANLVRHEFVPLIKARIRRDYMNREQGFAGYMRQRSDIEYKTEKRNMKSLVYPMTKADFIYAIRKGIHGSTKS